MNNVINQLLTVLATLGLLVVVYVLFVAYPREVGLTVVYPTPENVDNSSIDVEKPVDK